MLIYNRIQEIINTIKNDQKKFSGIFAQLKHTDDINFCLIFNQIANEFNVSTACASILYNFVKNSINNEEFLKRIINAGKLDKINKIQNFNWYSLLHNDHELLKFNL